MEDQIRKILSDILGETYSYTGTDMFEDGIIDSLEMMELITAIETEYKIEIDGEDIIPENFRTISAIVKLVKKTLNDK